MAPAAPHIPDALKDELHGETPQFVVRERRAFSRRALQNCVLGCAVFVAAYVFAGARGLADTYRIGFLVTGAGWALLGAAGWTIPGGTVVGTPTRLLRTRSFGIGLQVASWRDYRGVAEGKDGSVELERYGSASKVMRLDDIAAPQPAEGLASVVRALVEGPVKEAVKVRAAHKDYRFASTHTPATPGALLAWVIGGALALVGVVVLGGMLLVLARGGSADGDGELVVAVPLLIGAALLAAGVGLSLIGRTRRRPVEYLATATGLEVSPARGKKETIPWQDFEGSYRRMRRWGREELRLPLRTTMPSRFVKGAEEQKVLRIVGLREPDEVAAELLRRIRV